MPLHPSHPRFWSANHRRAPLFHAELPAKLELMFRRDFLGRLTAFPKRATILRQLLVRTPSLESRRVAPEGTCASKCLAGFLAPFPANQTINKTVSSAENFRFAPFQCLEALFLNARAVFRQQRSATNLRVVCGVYESFLYHDKFSVTLFGDEETSPSFSICIPTNLADGALDPPSALLRLETLSSFLFRAGWFFDRRPDLFFSVVFLFEILISFPFPRKNVGKHLRSESALVPFSPDRPGQATLPAGLLPCACVVL